ncbi:MAG TPA: orotate phosphoribosyltransferase [Gemmatimonadales bacterium]|nr:orotate phosphoribosyltransferase [Gemmatimonadales bacterium]
MATDRETLLALLAERSVRFGDFVLASGARSSYYVDCRPTTMSAIGQRVIGRLGLAAIREAGWQPRAVGGLTMGADPVAYAIAAASGDDGDQRPETGDRRSENVISDLRSPVSVIDAFSVRKSPKDHGTGKRIEGNFAAGMPVVVVEDVITSGGSALDAIAAVRAEGGEVVGVLAVLDRESGGKAKIEAAGVPVVVLVTASELGLRN